jgi:hypothetical protein
MLIFRKLAWAIAPELSLKVKLLRRIRAAMATNDALAGMAEIRPELIANTVTLANRDALIDQMPKGGIAAELGVMHGDFAARILARNSPAHLHLVDIWAETGRMARVAQRFSDQPVSLHQGWSWEVVSTFPDQSLSWVYVDASHDFHSVERDLTACLPKVLPGGFIAGHDYTRWKVGTHQVVRYGVIEAVNSFCNRHSLPLTYLTAEASRHLSFAIRLPDRASGKPAR